MVGTSPWERLKLAQQQSGLDDQELAKRLGVSVTAMNRWRTAGIPSPRIENDGTSTPTISRVLAVSGSWIHDEVNPPAWHVAAVLRTGNGKLAFAPERKESGELETSAECEARQHFAIYHCWLDLLRSRLHEALALNDREIPIPSKLHVPRWRFLADPFASWIDRLNGSEVTALARHLGCHPVNELAATEIRRSLDSRIPSPISGASDTRADSWSTYLESLRRGLDQCAKASRDPRRLRVAQDSVRQQLESRFEGERLVGGAAVIPVLGATVRAAYEAGIFGAHLPWLRRSIETALLGSLFGRRFMMQDVAREIELATGLKIGSNEGGSLGQSFVSYDTVLREMKAVQKERPGGIRLKLVGKRTWTVSIARPKRIRGPALS